MTDEQLSSLLDQTAEFVKAVHAHVATLSPMENARAWVAFQSGVLWHQVADPFEGLRVTATPARHNSGRATGANQSLWCSFVLQWGAVSLFAGGDSGYDYTFKHVGDKFGPFDLAFLECGLYHAAWPCVHMFPE